VPDPGQSRLFRLQVHRARGWTAFPDDVTAWSFD